METKREITIALTGNPNVGKSTVFNALTGLKQHTGNWAGKTVDVARGEYNFRGRKYKITDLPGTYSLIPHSAEETVARDYICFEAADVTVVVCDATCLERNLNLVLQILEIKTNVVVALNLIDEADKKNICIDSEKLAKKLGVPVIPMSARSRKGLERLMAAIEAASSKQDKTEYKIPYSEETEKTITAVTDIIAGQNKDLCDCRWLAIQALENEYDFINKTEEIYGLDLGDIKSDVEFTERLVSEIMLAAEEITRECLTDCGDRYAFDRRIDRFILGRYTSLPVMLIFMLIIFWITIAGANYPSRMLSEGFSKLGEIIRPVVFMLPEKTASLVFDGVYNVLTWIIAVMLPPMAIFFPMFTLLEDLGFLPRIAFNLDGLFKRANACGKQALTICAGFGCNVCGVTGARIIDSPRERLVAIITNVFIPCNGRLPILTSLISVFIIAETGGMIKTLSSALVLTALITFSIIMTLVISKLLTKTILRGMPSSFTLELPPYRKPQVGKVIIRSVFDRTLFVLGRALIAAIPAGIIIWCLANFTADGIPLLRYCSDFFEPLGKVLGMDGVIILAFILGFPANEIVLPLMVMCYLSDNSLGEIATLSGLREVLVANGWTVATAVSVMLFTLFHFPCATTCITVFKETRSIKWTVAAVAVPLLTGIIICFLFNLLCN